MTKKTVRDVATTLLELIDGVSHDKTSGGDTLLTIARDSERRRLFWECIVGFRAAVENNGWRPIETAPTRQYLLVLIGGKVDVGFQTPDGYWLDPSDAPTRTPTAWQPLPPLPNTTAL